MSKWVEGKCYAPCTGAAPKAFGTANRTRTINRKPINNGTECGELVEKISCENECDITCAVGPWANWGACSEQCGPGSSDIINGTRTRTRIITRQGINCPPLDDEEYCEDLCPVPCEFNYILGPCNAACEKYDEGPKWGEQTRSIVVTMEPRNKGKECPTEATNKLCNVTCTPECRMDEWSPWTCDAKCPNDGQTPFADGNQTRTRPVLVPGDGCEPANESLPCQVECNVDCSVSDWIPGTCVYECQEGQHGVHYGTANDTRYITTEPRGTGQKCPALSRPRTCPQDCGDVCQPGPWSNWVCNVPECLEGAEETRGKQTRTRELVTGKPGCAKLEQKEGCSKPCKTDCVLSEWTESPCDAECKPGQSGTAKGKRLFQRHILTSPTRNGKQCDILERKLDCLIDCGSSCKLSNWSPWHCDAKCETGQTVAEGTKSRKRKVVIPGNCGKLEESEKCIIPCSVDCKLSNWTKGPCDAKCTDDSPKIIWGKSLLTRYIIQNATKDGKVCEGLTDFEDCTVDCKQKCETEEWSAWGNCNATCTDSTNGIAKGHQFRERKVKTYGDGQCPPLTDTKTCGITGCDQDCKMSDWFYHPCDAKCGPTDSTSKIGKKLKERTILKPQIGNGLPCEKTKDHEDCLKKCEPEECLLSPFGPYSLCNATCNNRANETVDHVSGYRKRTRSIIKPGARCDELEQYDPCGEHCDVDCVLGEWTDGLCDAVCGTGLVGGNVTRTREILVQPRNNGRKCDDLSRVEYCTKECKTPCETSEFIPGPCSAKCGEGLVKGKRILTRQITQQPKYGGEKCGKLTVEEDCERQCEVDCELGDWFKVKECNASCTTGDIDDDGNAHGFYTEERNVTKAPEYKGKDCEEKMRKQPCEKPCALDCEIGEFEESSPCDAVCDGKSLIVQGYREFTRTLIQPKFGGAACPNATKKERCNIECDLDCIVGDWENVGQCKGSNCLNGQGNGTMTQKRTIIQERTGDGKLCPDLEQTVECELQNCPVCGFKGNTICSVGQDDCPSTGGIVLRGNDTVRYYVTTEHVDTCHMPDEIIGECEYFCPEQK
eukprot:Pgem_evm2s3006